MNNTTPPNFGVKNPSSRTYTLKSKKPRNSWNYCRDFPHLYNTNLIINEWTPVLFTIFGTDIKKDWKKGQHLSNARGKVYVTPMIWSESKEVNPAVFKREEIALDTFIMSIKDNEATFIQRSTERVCHIIYNVGENTFKQTNKDGEYVTVTVTPEHKNLKTIVDPKTNKCKDLSDWDVFKHVNLVDLMLNEMKFTSATAKKAGCIKTEKKTISSKINQLKASAASRKYMYKVIVDNTEWTYDKFGKLPGDGKVHKYTWDSGMVMHHLQEWGCQRSASSIRNSLSKGLLKWENVVITKIK